MGELARLRRPGWRAASATRSEHPTMTSASEPFGRPAEPSQASASVRMSTDRDTVRTDREGHCQRKLTLMA
jgi:hypothetical protein